MAFSFCEGSCHAIGRVTGECNSDFTDCTCSKQKVTPKQYAICLKEGICGTCCQRQGFATGKCAGPTGWDCKCVSGDDVDADDEGVDVNVDDYDFDDIDVEDLGDGFDLDEFDIRSGSDI